jgi:putative selenium metabolism protein SsnA
MATLSLTGATVVTSLDPPRIAVGDVVVEDGRVRAVGAALAEGARRDCSGCLIIPGNVCGHTHLYSALARGMPYRLPPPTDFLQILQRVWWRLDRALDEETIRASALAGGAAALLAGTTTVIDHHASPNAVDGSLDIIAEALEGLGLRSVLCYEVSDRDGPRCAAAGLAENRRFLARRRALTRGLFGAHASFTLSADTLAACVDGARAAGVGLHIHVAEDAVDRRDALARFGMPPIPRLATAGALTPQAVLAHCIHLDEHEISMVVASGASVAHNPTSNMNNAVGHTPVGRLGDRVVIGTDGIGADMFREVQTAYFRAREEELSLPVGWSLARTAEAARLAGRIFGEPLLGTIQPGAPADLVVLDCQAPTPLTEDNLAGHWVFGFHAACVRDVLVAGEIVVEHRRVTRADQAQLAAQAAAQARRLWERLEAVDAHPFTPAGGC